MIYLPIAGGVAAASGFLAAGTVAGIKDGENVGKKDVALLYTEHEAVAGGVFTTNRLKAPPLLLTKERIKNGLVRAVVINSGNANVCNGYKGMEDAKAMAFETALALSLPEKQVLVASTGVIGQPMPIERVLAGVHSAAAKLSSDGGHEAAEAIMTTDTVTKEIAMLFELDGVRTVIGGMAKGSGMIHPNMATMLCFITTDVSIEQHLLQQALVAAVEQSFNMITVDGDTSTNDMVIVLANGTAGNTTISTEGEDYATFAEVLAEVCRQLAMAIIADGEGATRLLEVQVQGAADVKNARLIARSIASSSLVKTALFGKDANWGRVICAAGYSGGDFNPDTVDIYINDLQVAKNSVGLPFDESRASELLAQDKVVFTIDLHCGESTATAWGCDLSYEYVHINGSYRS